MVVNTPLGTTQDVEVGQFGPVTTICAVDVLKLLPLIVNEKVPGATVVGEILLIEGTLCTAMTNVAGSPRLTM